MLGFIDKFVDEVLLTLDCDKGCPGLDWFARVRMIPCSRPDLKQTHFKGALGRVVVFRPAFVQESVVAHPLIKPDFPGVNPVLTHQFRKLTDKD